MKQRMRAVVVALALVFTSCTSQTSAHASTTVKSGAYEGWCAPSAVTEFASWRSKPVAAIMDSLDQTNWAYLEDSNYLTNCYKGIGWLVFAVPMLENSTDTLSAGASGAYDAHFRTLAQNLVAANRSGVGLRLGWEFNGSWYKWAAATNPAAFITYWRRIVNVMRSVSGAHFLFIWNPVNGNEPFAADKAWPGDPYVDNVGLDIYDACWVSGTYPYSGDRTTAQNKAWDSYVNGDHGMAFWASFAAKHRKPLGVPEWGLVQRGDGHGGGDDPVFVQNMRTWINSHNVTYEMYFDAVGDLGEHRLRSGSFPDAAAKYLQLFGG